MFQMREFKRKTQIKTTNTFDSQLVRVEVEPPAGAPVRQSIRERRTSNRLIAMDGKTTRKFFSNKADRSPKKKPQFDVRTVLFKADHLKAATTRSAPGKAYKFFSSKNTAPARVSVPVSNLQSNIQPRSSVRNGTTAGSQKKTSPVARKTRSENTENMTVAQTKASSDRTGRPVVTPIVQPTKQSKRIRAEDPDPVDPSVITGRRSHRLDRSTAPESQEPVHKKAMLSEELETADRQSPHTRPSPQPSPASPSPPPSLPPHTTPVIDDLPDTESPHDVRKTDDEATTSHSRRPEPVEQVVSEPAKLPVAKPRKKFFTSKNSASLYDCKKQKPHLDFKKFFKSDFEDSFAEDKGTKESGTEAMDEYVTMQRVRKAHQCHEMGETESFDEDISYNLNGLEKTNTSRIRCLSIEALTAQCMRPEFRMHLRAHDDMPRIISALSDAPSDPSLAFCTAALMFVYNQDRLTMDIDPNHLRLMLDLLEVKEDQVEKAHQVRAKEQVEQMKSRGHGKFLDPNNLSAGKLALEALLGLTSKRAGDWFKEELRNLKGLDFLMNTVISISRRPDKLHTESELTKVDRTLRVLEAATFMHEDNQLYTIQYEDGSLIRSCTDLLKLCKEAIIYRTDCRAYLSTLLSVLRVFTNITSESGRGSQLMGRQFEYLLNLFLDLLFEVPSFVLPDARFDLMVLLLCLCINLVEYHEPLRSDLLDSHFKLKSLVEILLTRVEEAKETEQQADDLLETAEKDQMTEIVNIDTLLNQVVAKSGKHMEHSIIAACVSLLLGCSIQDNPAGKDIVTSLLPDQSFDPLIDVLRKLHEFAHLAVSRLRPGSV